MFRLFSSKNRDVAVSHRSSLALLVVFCFLTACSTTSRESVAANSSNPVKGPPMPDLLDDPYEPVNRGIWAFNEGLLNTVIHPSSRVYHTVVPQPVRNSITKFGRNIAYPGRLVNHVLQGRWEGAGNETLRFVSNTTVGLGGFFDPSSTWNIEKSDANFNQTFAKWGMKRDNFVMLPVLGPSDHRNVLGRIGDELSEPLNYYKPYSNISYVTAYNEVAGVAGDVSRLIDQENDPYFFTRYGWTYAAKEGLPDLEMTESVDVPTLETLNAIRLRPEDPEFIYEGSETAVRIPATGKKLEFNYWMQPDPAPLVYLTPGLNSHRVSQLSIAMAEQLYRNGFSVVSISSVFHPEFMRNA